MHKIRIVGLLLFAFLSLATKAQANEGCVLIDNPNASRVAIVIGNGAYLPAVGPLDTPKNDAWAIAQMLQKLAFAVVYTVDGTSELIDQCVDVALNLIQQPEIALLHYSGHGVQLEDRNYLIAVDADVSAEPQRGLVALQPIVEKLQNKAEATLVFLDACRQNALSQRERDGLSVSIGRSIKPSKSAEYSETRSSEIARGILIAYANLPNTMCPEAVAGSHSPFSQAMLDTLPTDGLSLQEALGRITNLVGENTLWAQTPWARFSLTGEIRLAARYTQDQIEEASKNWAAESEKHLRKGRKREAIIAGLKGLPGEATDGDLARFSKAFEAVSNAFRSGVAMIPVEDDSALTLQSADKTYIALTSKNAEGYANSVWDAASGTKMFETLTGQDAGWQFFFSDSERFLAQTKSESHIDIWSIDKREKVASLQPDCGMTRLGTVEHVAFSQDDRKLLVDQGNIAVVYDISASPATCRIVVKTADQVGLGVAVSFIDENRICVAELNGDGENGGRVKVQILDLRTREKDVVFESRLSPPIYTLAVECTPSARFASISYLNGAGESYVEIWDRGKDSSGKATTAAAIVTGAYRSKFSTDGRYVAFDELSNTKFIDLETMEKTTEPYGDAGLHDRVEGVFNSNGILIAGYAPDSRKWLWEKNPSGLELLAAADELLDDQERQSIAAERINPK